jgi:hypothetical protein
LPERHFRSGGGRGGVAGDEREQRLGRVELARLLQAQRRRRDPRCNRRPRRFGLAIFVWSRRSTSAIAPQLDHTEPPN